MRQSNSDPVFAPQLVKCLRFIWTCYQYEAEGLPDKWRFDKSKSYGISTRQGKCQTIKQGLGHLQVAYYVAPTVWPHYYYYQAPPTSGHRARDQIKAAAAAAVQLKV